MLPSYILFALLASVGFALSNLVNKFTSKHRIKDSWVLLFYYFVGLLPYLFLLPIFTPVSMPSSGWIFVIGYAILFFGGDILFTKALYHLDASTIAPLFQLQSAIIAPLAFLLLGERFSPFNYIIIAVMVVGSMLVSIDERMSLKSYFRLATLLVIGQQLLHALSNISAGFALRSMNSFTFLFWGDLTSALLAFTFIPIFIRPKLSVGFRSIQPLFISGLFSTIGAVSLFTAYQTNVTISSVLSLLTSPIVFVVSVVSSAFFPKLLEHHTLKVYSMRAFGVILILSGAVYLSLMK